MTITLSEEDTFERFVALTKLAKLKRRQANGDASNLALIGGVGDATEKAVRYSAECVALEVYRSDPKKFSPQVHVRFAAIGRIVDAHIPRGSVGIDQRRALVERAEEFAVFSPHYGSLDETDDNGEIADRLNATSVASGISRFLLDRELGSRRLRPPKELFDVDKPFTPEQARELTDELGHLHQELGTRLRQIDDLFSDPLNDRISWGVEAVREEISEMSRKLESKPIDPSLLRINNELLAEKEKAKRAISNESSFSSSSVAQAAKPKRSHAEIAGGADSDLSIMPTTRPRRLGLPAEPSALPLVERNSKSSSAVPALTTKRPHAEISPDMDIAPDLQPPLRRPRLGTAVRPSGLTVVNPEGRVVTNATGTRKDSKRGELQHRTPDRSRDGGLGD